MSRTKKFFRGVVLVLSLSLLILLSLLVGSVIGVTTATIVNEFRGILYGLGPMITERIEMTPRFVQSVANGILSLEVFRTISTSLSSLVVVLVPVILGSLIARVFGQSLYESIVGGLNKLMEVIGKIIASNESGVSISSSFFEFLKVGIQSGLYWVGLPSVLFSSYSAIQPTAIQPTVTLDPKYVIAKADSSLLPVQLVVPFENAATNMDGELTERGTSLDAVRKATLEKTMHMLAGCVTPEGKVSIQPYGFASDDPFLGMPRNESDKLNVRVANSRAEAVYKALMDLPNNGVKIRGPKLWANIKEMESRRNSMIVVPEETDRDAVSDRVVLLSLSDPPGNCKLVVDTLQ